MRLLTPTENRRLNELIGFLGLTLAVLLALALLSYSPHDPSFNVSAQPPDAHPARNWIGPVGAYSADLIFQGFGYAAFLLPLGFSRWGCAGSAARRWTPPLASWWVTRCWCSRLPALLTLWHVPDVRGAIPPGGLLGTLVAAGCAPPSTPWARMWWPWRLFFTALFLATRFSLSARTTGPRPARESSIALGRLRRAGANGARRAKQERLASG